MKKRIVTIVGARPQFIKAAALSRALKNHLDIDEIIIHTGQHFDKNMSDVFFEELNIPKPKYFLDIHSSSHGHMTGRMLSTIEEILMQEKPHRVLVYGDTNSTLAGALAASKLHIPVAHIESGLRSYNKKMPEEINRILTDHISDLLFCPTKISVKNLQEEGIEKGVHYVGDIMYDATLFAKNFITDNQELFEKKFDFISQNFAFMTIHRQESTETSEEFFKLLDYTFRFAKDNGLQVVFPVHPRIKRLIEKVANDLTFCFIDPLSYFETQYLLSKASYVLTDSGGLQKEAYFHRVPCITLRSSTEWVETVEAGWNRLWKEGQHRAQKDIEDYGTGHSCEKIITVLLRE
jgi:UDP-N-acetylglucosamine 2-epimerase